MALNLEAAANRYIQYLLDTGVILNSKYREYLMEAYVAGAEYVIDWMDIGVTNDQSKAE